MALGVSEGLSDLSENSLALVSGWQLMKAIYNGGQLETSDKALDFDNTFKKNIAAQIVKWFEMSDNDIKNTECIISTQIKSNSVKLKLEDWLGSWTSEVKSTQFFGFNNQFVGFNKNSKVGIIDFPKPNSFQDRYLMSLYLSIASADLRENAGYLENAAREYLQICDTISQYFWWICSMNQLKEVEISNEKRDKRYLLHCLSISVWILEYIDKLYRLESKTQIKGNYKIGKTIPPFALTLACSLSIVTRLIFPAKEVLSSKDKKSIQLLWSRLTKLIIAWRGENFKIKSLKILSAINDIHQQKIIKKFKSQKSCEILIVYLQGNPGSFVISGHTDEGFFRNIKHNNPESQLTKELNRWVKNKWIIDARSMIVELVAFELGFTSFKDRQNCTIDEFKSILKQSICTHKFPVLNQINTLKLLIDTDVFTEGNLSSECTDWVEELHELNCRYNAPLHFTPNMMGITYASFWLQYQKEERPIKPLSFDLKSEILRSFRISREMYTMGRSYYTSIDNLYYLYDDFNDRLIHRNHAMQMASAELVRQYEKRIK